MGKTPPKPTGNKINDLINFANCSDKFGKVRSLLIIRKTKKENNE